MVVLTFGKYKSEDIVSVWEKDPGYILWIRESENLNPEIKSECINLSSLYEKGTYFLSWGKYKGKALVDVSKIDSDYIDWLKNNQFVKEKCPRLSSELEKYN